MASYGDTLQKKLRLAHKTGGDVQIEVLGTWKHQGAVVVVAAVAEICYKQDTAVGQVSPSSSFAVDYANLGRRLNRKVQMTKLRGSFSQPDTETLLPSKHMLLCCE